MAQIKKLLQSRMGVVRRLGGEGVVDNREGKARLIGMAGGVAALVGVLVALVVR